MVMLLELLAQESGVVWLREGDSDRAIVQKNKLGVLKRVGLIEMV